MKTLGKIFLVLIGLLLLLQLAILSAIALSNRITPKTVLTLRISGDIPEQPPQDAILELVAGHPMTVTEITEALDRARADSRISGLELRVGISSLNLGALQEIREKIREFNRGGKFSIAYLEYATNGSYYLASSCQQVFLLPESLVEVHGLMASSTFLRGTFDKLGIYPDYYHIGEYKNASNIYTEKKYTAAHRRATQALLEDWYGQFLNGIAEARGLKADRVRSAIEKGPFNSDEALAAKLVDRIAYEDEARDFVREKNQGSENRLGLREYLRRTRRGGKFKLAVIYATGIILPGRSGTDPFGDLVMGSDTIVEQFRQVRDDSTVKAVVLRVDSPGGSAFSSEVIRREVELTKRRKPVVVSMSDVAASGGYWISMSANKIVAEPATITGSIGVLAGKFNIQGFYDKLGLSKDYVALSDNATIEWPFKNFTPAQRESVLKYMRDVYGNFVEGVARGRHMKVEDVDRIAQGRIWTGERARQLGLVDELGGLDTALNLSKGLAGIPPSESVELIYLPRPKSLLERLAELSESAQAFGAGISPRQWLARFETFLRAPVWALAPSLPELD